MPERFQSPIASYHGGAVERIISSTGRLGGVACSGRGTCLVESEFAHQPLHVVGIDRASSE